MRDVRKLLEVWNLREVTETSFSNASFSCVSTKQIALDHAITLTDKR